MVFNRKFKYLVSCYANNCKFGGAINHVFPDVDRTVGIELTKVVKLQYPATILRKPYKEFTGDSTSVKTIKSQEIQREKWAKKIKEL